MKKKLDVPGCLALAGQKQSPDPPQCSAFTTSLPRRSHHTGCPSMDYKQVLLKKQMGLRVSRTPLLEGGFPNAAGNTQPPACSGHLGGLPDRWQTDPEQLPMPGENPVRSPGPGTHPGQSAVLSQSFLPIPRGSEHPWGSRTQARPGPPCYTEQLPPHKSPWPGRLGHTGRSCLK